MWTDDQGLLVNPKPVLPEDGLAAVGFAAVWADVGFTVLLLPVSHELAKAHELRAADLAVVNAVPLDVSAEGKGIGDKLATLRALQRGCGCGGSWDGAFPVAALSTLFAGNDACSDTGRIAHCCVCSAVLLQFATFAETGSADFATKGTVRCPVPVELLTGEKRLAASLVLANEALVLPMPGKMASEICLALEGLVASWYSAPEGVQVRMEPEMFSMTCSCGEELTTMLARPARLSRLSCLIPQWIQSSQRRDSIKKA
mmetsp:Transcript_6990/g.15054  ORF Transcript_6990/g.15054 Transcript_6990/m.15054 type:complete len:258 (+) Transcript_6990:373-1146(+)